MNSRAGEFPGQLRFAVCLILKTQRRRARAQKPPQNRAQRAAPGDESISMLVELESLRAGQFVHRKCWQGFLQLLRGRGERRGPDMDFTARELRDLRAGRPLNCFGERIQVCAVVVTTQLNFGQTDL